MLEKIKVILGLSLNATTKQKIHYSFFWMTLVFHTIAYLNHFIKTGRFPILFFSLSTLLIVLTMRFKEVLEVITFSDGVKPNSAQPNTSKHFIVKRTLKIFGPCGGSPLSKLFYVAGVLFTISFWSIFIYGFIEMFLEDFDIVGLMFFAFFLLLSPVPLVMFKAQYRKYFL